ncbi:hypothetical protein FB45DRAFT_894244 [Roridomyces roridus]|uniref:Uncharacterized protein n=1 Tax=Roridomyces roridus TaxID=1738132 RepID=A0AAD7CFW8_9AGAR|nr:hypothetical protein FB45DRAFT_894244 [Roridomyces roridus]
MPPRKKRKTDATGSSTETPERPQNFPSIATLARALDQHPYALALRSKEHVKTPDALTDLDAWLLTDLSAKIASSEPNVDKRDMQKLMQWKLSRGKSRPTLLALIASNPESLVLKSTSSALTTLRAAGDDLERGLLAVSQACAMKGVGAATASALLTLLPPHLLPFMSDEAASFFTSTLGPIKYTDAFYNKFARAMAAEVARLNSEADNMQWDAQKLQRALFAICILKKHGQDGVLDSEPSNSSSLKRQRDDS